MAMKFKPNKNLFNSLKSKMIPALSDATNILQNEIKDKIKSVFDEDTNSYSDSIKTNKDEINAGTTQVYSSAKYALAQEFGAVIKPKHDEYLKFKKDGRWVTTKEVILPARPAFRPALSSAKNKMLKCFKNIINKGKNA